MLNDDLNRREFLKKFAVLSTGALTLSAVTLACYGPSPNTPYTDEPQVADMYFQDAQSNSIVLYDNQDVPVHTKFTIAFTHSMNTSAPTTVFLTGPGDVSVEYDNKVWEGTAFLHLTPVIDLSPDTTYTLRVGDDAEDASGNKILLTEKATATFKTVTS